jgi:hypothetical protein
MCTRKATLDKPAESYRCGRTAMLGKQLCYLHDPDETLNRDLRGWLDENAFRHQGHNDARIGHWLRLHRPTLYQRLHVLASAGIEERNAEIEETA